MRIPTTPYQPPAQPPRKKEQQQMEKEPSMSNAAPESSRTSRKSWQKPPEVSPPSTTSTKNTPTPLKQTNMTSAEEKEESQKEAPYQLRHIKQNWNLSYVPKGAVADRMKVFSRNSNQGLHGDGERPELTNTGRTNPALRKRRVLEREQELERQRELEEKRRRAASKYGFGRTKKARDMAATDMQAIVRMHLAKAIIARKREQAATRAKKEQQLVAEQAELALKTEAAIKIQAVMRSAVTRMRVCRMVEDMINGLMQKEDAELRRLAEVEREAAALVARKQREKEAEKERLVQAAEAEARRLKEEEEEAAALEEEKRKQQKAEEERMALAALAREQREATADKLAQRKAQTEAEKEAELLANLEEEKARKEAAALERERRRKDLNLFTGPLPWGVGLLPDWWMAEVPHRSLFLDSITEETNGEEFEEWRRENVKQQAAC